MPTYIAFLRGINVGKTKRVQMSDLRALLSGLGYIGVETLLNSGNVVFRAKDGSAGQHSARIAAALTSELKVEVRVVVKSAAQLAAIIRENSIHVEADMHGRLLVAVAQDTKALASLAAIESLVVPPDQFGLGAHAAYLFCAAGSLKSKAGAALLGKAGRSGTTRNWATMQKLHSLAARCKG